MLSSLQYPERIRQIKGLPKIFFTLEDSDLQIEKYKLRKPSLINLPVFTKDLF